MNENINRPIILVTGGSGFLGKNIVRELLEKDSPINPAEIRIYDKCHYNGIIDSRINFVQGDICDFKKIEEACKNVTLVIHSAAVIDWGTKSRSEVLDINVGGTENIVKACKKQNVQHLVYTSSLDAVFTGSDLIDIDESQPYPEKPTTSYCESKIEAEKLIIKANTEELKTCILRPSDIYGEEDPYHIDSLIDMAKTGFYIRLGNGKSKCQHVYVGNMAHAHVLVANALLQNNKNVFGKFYLITDGPGSNFFTFFDQIVQQTGYRIFPKNLWLPRKIAFALASITEFMLWIVSPIKKINPKFSRFAVTYTCNNFTFNSSQAINDFAWSPKYSTKEAIRNTINYYRKKKTKN